MNLCTVCGNWARERFTDDPHHPLCPVRLGITPGGAPVGSPALEYIRQTAAAAAFGTPHGINELPFVLWPAVGAMMEAYAGFVNNQLQGMVESLAERVAEQSELLTRAAERLSPPASSDV